MIWIFIAASVLSLAGIAYGVVVVRKNNERLGMHQITRWNRKWVPLTIVVGEEFLSEEQSRLTDAVKAAARFWNEQTKIKLFAPQGDVGDGGVIPIMRQPLSDIMADKHKDAVAYAELAINKSIKSAAVYMVNWENLPTTVLARAMKHELGHCLGLMHDEIEYSVMYGKTSKHVYCVSPDDKAFLKEVYG